MIGNGEAGKSRIGANVTEELQNNLVFTKECVFSISKRFSIPASGVVDIVFDSTGITSDFLVFLPVFFQGFEAGPIEIDLYAGTNADDDGTEIICFNRNELSVKPCGMKVWLNPTINDIGTKLPVEFEIPSDGTPATATLGGSAGDSIVTNINKAAKHTFRLTNIEASIARCVIAANWFEL